MPTKPRKAPAKNPARKKPTLRKLTIRDLEMHKGGWVRGGAAGPGNRKG